MGVMVFFNYEKWFPFDIFWKDSVLDSNFIHRYAGMMRSLISWVNDNHVDNNHKEILGYVYYGSIVNNWPQKLKNKSSLRKHAYSNI